MGIPQPPALQAQVTRSVSFQDVIDQNPEGWAKETPEFKNNLADQFFAKHVATQQGFADEAPDVQTQVRTQFNKQYGVGGVAPTDNIFQNVGKAVDTGILYANSVANPAIKAMTFGLSDGEATDKAYYSKVYPNIQTDPGMLGDAYRARQNPWAQGIGGALGAGAGVQSLAKGIGNWAIPAFSAAGNAVNVLKGEASPLQGGLQTLVDTATGFIPGGKTFLGNAIKQGAGGAVGGALSSGVNDLATGKSVDINRAMQEAFQQGLIGAGMGAGHHLANRPAVQAGPKVRGMDRAQYIGLRDKSQPFNVRTQTGQLSANIQKSIQGNLDQAARHQSVTEAGTMKTKIDALKKQYESLSQLANNPMAHQKVRRNAQVMQAKILEVHNQLAAQHRQQFGKAPGREKQAIDHSGPDFKNVVALVKDMRAKGNVKQANLMLNAFQPETKAKLYDEVHRQEQEDKKTLKASATKVAAPRGEQIKTKDMLLDALRAATEKPGTPGSATEYRAPGPDEYSRMAKEAGGIKASATKVAAPSKPLTGKVAKRQVSEKTRSDAQQSRENREEITKTLKALRQHNDWAEQPARDFLDRHGIVYKKLPNKGNVLTYGIFIPRKGMIAFKHNAPVKWLLDKTGIPAIASKINKGAGAEGIHAELRDLPIDENVFTGDKHELFQQAEQAANDQMKARDAEENAYYGRVEKHEAHVRNAMEQASSLDDLGRIFDHLDSDKYHDMPPEFFDSMLKEYDKHVARIEHEQESGSAQPKGSTGEDSQNAGGGQGQNGGEGQKLGRITQKDLMPVDAMRQVAKEANSAGETVRVRYWAERTGETGEFHYKTLHDVKIRPGKDGKETKWNGINADGQSHTYIERNNAGNLQDSNIISVERTGKPVEFERTIHPDTGEATVRHIESGEIIPQISKKGVKSSSLHARMGELITAVNEGKHVPVDRIINTAREFSKQKELQSQLESLSQEERAKLYEEATGKPC